jgi:hypothetical protein
VIHGVISTYFGDLEYDIGKSLNWTQYHCDTVYVLDSNTADGTRQYIIDWEHWLPKAKYSFNADGYFGDVNTAALWRAEAFARADAAWGYDDEDWVLFIDGTEALNVFHAPPIPLTITDVTVDGPGGEMVYTTSVAHDVVVGNVLSLVDSAVVVPEFPSDTYVHTQGPSAEVWTITHDLFDLPQVTNLVTTPVEEPVSVEYPDRNTVIITFAQAVDGSVDLFRPTISETEINLTGSYFVRGVPSSTEILVEPYGPSQSYGPEPVVLPTSGNTIGPFPTASYTTEPSGYYEGSIFQSWLNAEIEAAEDVSATKISMAGWAMIRSEGPEEVLMQMVATEFASVIPGAIELAGDWFTVSPRCEEYFVSMGSLTRLVKVSELRDPGFDWGVLDIPDSDTGDMTATNLDVISYAYVRWAENPADMTQMVDVNAPHYVAGGSGAPPLRPISVEADVGFAMRRLISTVRPLAGVPLVWGTADPAGSQPTVGGFQRLDNVYVARYSLSGPDTVFGGYSVYGGSPLYPGVIRSNLREGVWYLSSGERAVSLALASVAFDSGVATLTTAARHYVPVGTAITVHGVNSAFDTTDDGYGLFDGDYVVQAVTRTEMLVERDVPGLTVPTTLTPLGRIVTRPVGFGPMPWNYLLNTLGIDDPDAWVMKGNAQLPISAGP